MDKQEVAEVLEEIATLLELKGENPFKTRAYTQGARILENLQEPLELLLKEERLGKIKGIGTALESKIRELVETGELEYYTNLKASIPEGWIQMLEIPGLGPKKIRALSENLQIETVEQLESACREGKVASVSGFGAKTEKRILEGIEFQKKFSGRHLLSRAILVSERIRDFLREIPETIRCEAAGSLRRWRETIGDLDFVVSSAQPATVLEIFTQMPEVTQVLGHGETKASVILEDGIQADLRVVPDDQFASALAYFTGSKEHNIVMRQRAIERGLRLNEYGLFQIKAGEEGVGTRLDTPEEADLFRALDLAYIPPELREDLGEFAAAEKDQLPRLLEWTDLKGSLHNHSEWSDGRGSLREIADHMIEIGLAYWAITDHSQTSFQARGLDVERLQRQMKEIDTLNQQLEEEGQDFRLLMGSEVDVLTSGKLDFPDDLLASLDVVVASIHQGFQQDATQITDRLVAAAENPNVHMLGHLSGRLILSREAYALHTDAVIQACARTGTWIELNASPRRLDLDWRKWKMARDLGVRCVINCDAHSFHHVQWLRLGAGVARKGWLRKEDVINTLPLPQLRKALAGKPGRKS